MHWDRRLFPFTGFQTAAGIFRSASTKSRPHLLAAFLSHFVRFANDFSPDFSRRLTGGGDFRIVPAVIRTGLVAISVYLVLCGALRAATDQEIRVPFNFQWGESSQRLEEGLLKVKARIVERKTVEGRNVLVVEGIPQKLLQRALFYFESDALNEIELHYGDRSWDSVQYGQFFDQTRRNIDSKYGMGRVIARQKTREGEILQTLIGYQWVQATTSLQLFLYTAEKGADSLRVLSLHYRGI